MRKAILATLVCLAMIVMAVPASSEPVQIGHTWGTPYDEFAYAVDVDSSGNVYLSGTISDPRLAGQASFVAKVDVYGHRMWDIVLSSTTNSLSLVDATLGPANSLYIVGQYTGISESVSGVFYAKIDSSGAVVYQKYLPDIVAVHRICTGAGGSGFSFVGDIEWYGPAAVVTVKDDGTIKWALTGNSPDGVSPWAVVTDSTGAVYTFMDSQNDSNVAIAKFNKVGRLVTQKFLQTESPYDEYTWDLAIGRDGNIYALGANYAAGTLLLASFTPKLEPLWDEYVGTPLNGYEATRLVAAADGSLYAVGVDLYGGDTAIFHLSASGAVLDSTLFPLDPRFGWYSLADACAYPRGGILLAGESYGFPKTRPTAIADIGVGEIPGVWQEDTIVWTQPSLSVNLGDVFVRSAEGVMDNFNDDQGLQAWYGLLNPPQPAFQSTITVQTTSAPLDLIFSAKATGGRAPYAYEWYFGDGAKASGQTVEHAYAIGGYYQIFLVVTDAKKAVSWAVADVTLPSSPVITDLTHYPDPSYVGQTVTFEVYAYDPDGGPLSYLWNFGDGTTYSTPNSIVYHSYSATGLFFGSVTATDNEGLSATAPLSVSVIQKPNNPPYAQFNYYPIPVYAGKAVTFDGSPSYDTDGTIVSYSWNFGDMGTGSGRTVVHTYASPGMYYVTLTVTDNLGATGYRVRNVTVLQSAPTASFSATVVDTTVYVNATSSSAPAGIASYTWNWGDGSPLQVVTSPWASHTYALSGAGLATAPQESVTAGPPPTPYIVFGYVTTPDRTPVKGCNITISNLRTGVSVNTTTDYVYGYYQYDLSSIQSGWMNGDVIRVSAFNGVMTGVNQSVANSTTAYLWIDVVISSSGTGQAYTITLKVTDNLGQTASTSKVVWIGPPTGERQVTYEISHFFESYLKNQDLTIQGNRTATPGLNSWWVTRATAYGDPIVRNAYPFVTAYQLESGYTVPAINPGFGLTSMARMHITAMNLDTIGTNIGKDPIFIPILNPNVGGGTLTLQWRSDVMAAAEISAMKAVTSNYFGRTYYGAPRVQLTDDGYWNQIYGHMTFDRLAARTYLGLAGVADLRTEFATANAGNAIGNLWLNDWMTETGHGGIYDIQAGYEFSNDIRQLVLTLDPSSTANMLNVRIWSVSWGNDIMLVRYMDVSGLNPYMQSPFEDMYLNATIGPTSGSIETSYYMQYAVLGWADASEDEASWMLEAMHIDYVGTNEPPPAWQSRFNPYDPDLHPTLTRLSRLPGTVHYGLQVNYWNAPMFWNLKAGEKLTVKLPTTDAVGFSPYNGTSDSLNTAKVTELNSHAYSGQLVLGNGNPNMSPYYNSATKTITIVGPTSFQRNPNPASPAVNYTGVPDFVFDVYKPPVPYPYPLVGIAFDNNGVPMGGVIVNITNARTGQSGSIVSDSTPGAEGYYIFDLSTLGQAQPGDLISIFASTATLTGSNQTFVPNPMDGYMWLNVTLVSSGPPSPPEAYMTYSGVGLRVVFDGSYSWDSDGTIISYQWSFGDGTNASGMVVNHTYQVPGTYTVRLIVVNDHFLFGLVNETVSVGETPPLPAGWSEGRLIQATTEYEQAGQVGMDDLGNAVVLWEEPFAGNDTGTSPGIWSVTYNALSGWGVPEKVWDGDFACGYTALGVGPNGHAVAAYYGETTPGTFVLHLSLYNRSIGWGTPSVVQVGTGYGELAAAVDANGNVMVIVSSQPSLMLTAVRNSGSGWVSDVIASTEGAWPMVRYDRSGCALVMWNDFDTYQVKSARYVPGSGWGPVMVASGSVGGYWAAMDVGDNGVAVTAFFIYNGTAWDMYGNVFSPQTGWGTPTHIGPAANGWHPYGASVASGAPGQFFVTWEQSDAYNDPNSNRSVWSRIWTSSGGWGPATMVNSGTSKTTAWGNVMADDSGNAILIWTEGTSEMYGVMASRYTPETGWSTPFEIDTTHTNIAWVGTGAMAPNGDAVVIWRQSNGVDDLLWARVFDASLAP